MDIVENLKKEKTKWENRIYGVGETRIDLMIEDVIRALQKYQNELEKKDKENRKLYQTTVVHSKNSHQNRERKVRKLKKNK